MYGNVGPKEHERSTQLVDNRHRCLPVKTRLGQRVFCAHRRISFSLIGNFIIPAVSVA